MPKRTPKTEGATVTDIKPTRAKQGELKGIEAPNHPELDTLMEEHDSQATAIGTGRQRLGELKVQLEQKADELRLKNYRHPTIPELVLTIAKGSTKVKVVRGKAKPAQHDEASGE